LGDDVLAERALVDEAVAQRCTPRGRVQCVAFPFVAPIAKRLERIAGEQILRFGAERRALQPWRIEHVADFDDSHLRLDPHQREIADRMIGSIDDRVSVRVVRPRAHRDERRKLVEARERTAGGDVSPDLILPGKDLPQIASVIGCKLLDAAIAALQRHRARPRRRRRVDRQSDGLAGLRMRLRSGHDESFLRSSRKNLFSSGLEISPAKPSNLPSLAISVATWMKACIATRASEPPTLMRRTPMAAMSSTVKPNAPLLRKLTGFGAPALTTASICSRVLMPGA